MSDQDEDYTNLDLETAEQLVIAAGQPKLAPALHKHAQGVRNLVQGEWGKSFVKSLEDINERQTQAIVETMRGELGALRGEVSASNSLFQESLDGLALDFAALKKNSDDRGPVIDRIQRDIQLILKDRADLRKRINTLDKRDATQYKETQRLFRESEERQRALAAEVAAVRADFAGYAAGSKRDEFARRLDELETDRGDYSPEERADLVGTLLRMIAEYKQAHGDGE